MTAQLTINGKHHKLMNKWTIPQYLVDDYCNSNFVLQDYDSIVEVYVPRRCPGCGREWKMATKPVRVICPVKEFNYSMGYPVGICIDCYWFCESLKGIVVPKSIEQTIQNGFKPTHLWDYI